MTQQSFGSMIQALRKQQGMTQLDLARTMGVTDKAVSKWERDLSMPDVGSLPKLAETLGVTVDELLQARTAADETPSPTRERVAPLIDLVLKAVALATGVGVTALTVMDKVEPRDALGLLGIGLACLAITQIAKTAEEH